MNTGASRDKMPIVSTPGRAGNPVRPWILRWIEFTFTAIALLVLLFATGLIQEFFTRTFPRYPDSWATIRPGMTSTEARAILGEPTADGRHLKSLDRWSITRKGVKPVHGPGTAGTRSLRRTMGLPASTADAVNDRHGSRCTSL